MRYKLWVSLLNVEALLLGRKDGSQDQFKDMEQTDCINYEIVEKININITLNQNKTDFELLNIGGHKNSTL